MIVGGRERYAGLIQRPAGIFVCERTNLFSGADGFYFAWILHDQSCSPLTSLTCDDHIVGYRGAEFILYATPLRSAGTRSQKRPKINNERRDGNTSVIAATVKGTWIYLLS